MADGDKIDATKNDLDLIRNLDQTDEAAQADWDQFASKHSDDDRDRDASHRDASPEPDADATSSADDADQDAPDSDRVATKSTDKADIWGTATPEQRAAYEAAQRRNGELEQHRRSSVGRISALTRKINQANPGSPASSPAKATEPGGSNASDANTASGDEREEKMKRLREEYPEFEPFFDKADKTEAENARLRQMFEAIGEIDAEDALAEQSRMMLDRHPSYEAEVRDPAFGRWLESQSRMVKEAVARNADHIVDAAEAADVVDMFKRSYFFKRSQNPKDGGAEAGGGETPRSGHNQQSLSARRARQLESASGVRNGGKRPSAPDIPAEDDRDGSWAYFAGKD